jgi:hypothetical protein
MRSPCCLCVCMCIPGPSTFDCLNEFFIKVGIYITASEPISTTYFINLFHQSVCLHMYLRNVVRQMLSKHIPTETNTLNKRRIVEGVVLYAVLIVSKKCLWVCGSVLCRPILLGNGSVKTFLLQRRIVGRVVFCAVRVLSMESRQLVPPRTPFFPVRYELNFYMSFRRIGISSWQLYWQLQLVYRQFLLSL